MGGLMGGPMGVMAGVGSAAGSYAGGMPIDKSGADGLFQILSHCYERVATLVTTNRVTAHGPASSTMTAC